MNFIFKIKKLRKSHRQPLLLALNCQGKHVARAHDEEKSNLVNDFDSRINGVDDRLTISRLLQKMSRDRINRNK